MDIARWFLAFTEARLRALEKELLSASASDLLVLAIAGVLAMLISVYLQAPQS